MRKVERFINLNLNYMSLEDTFNQRNTPKKHSKVGFFDEKDEEYEMRRSKMETNIHHHGYCVESPDKKRNQPPPSRDYKVSFEKETEKLEFLKDENIHLKQRKQDLEESVKQIATKLKRQINQLKKDRIVGGGGKLYNKIDDELDQLIEENVHLQDEEMKLMDKVRKMQQKRKMELSTGFNQTKVMTSTTQGFRKSSRSKSPGRAAAKSSDIELKSLRNNIELENKKLITLKQDVESLRRHTQVGVSQTLATEDLRNELALKQQKIRFEKLKLEELEEQFKSKDNIFGAQKQSQDELLRQLRDLQSEQLDLTKQNRAYQESAKETEYLQQKIAEVIIERDKLQKEFDTITRQPFFKREADQDHVRKLTSLEQEIDKKEKDIQRAKSNIITFEESKMKLVNEQKELQAERNTYAEEIERLKIQLDPNSLSLADIQKKIHSLDPVLFRQVMKDLQYDGDEPIWAKFDFMERLKLGVHSQPIDENDPLQMAREIERLKLERRDLATELQKTQNLLKIQVDIDKENAGLYQQRNNELNNQISADGSRIGEYNKLVKARNMKLLEIQKQMGRTRLTAAGLAGLDQDLDHLAKAQRDDDVMSQFSAMTHETELGTQENAFELIISTANLDKARLSQILGNQELLPSAVQTFATVDFYNHDTKSTDLSEGFAPNYSTQFSFKNNVDDFYVGYLAKNHVCVDLFLSRAQAAPKLGTARLPLSKLLENDQSFQAQELVHEGGEMGASFPIGRIFYRMRMRKSLDEALRWYKQKQTLNQQRDPASAIESHLLAQQQKRTKVIEIEVLRAHHLKRSQSEFGGSSSMQPFFYMHFYNFEYTSPVVQGDSPVFDLRKQFEVEETMEFLKYMKSEVLKLEFIDESADINIGQDEYIGSVRIPLREVLMQEVVADSFPVQTESGKENGRVDIRITCRDYGHYAEGVVGYGADGSRLQVGKYVEQEVVKKIAEALAEIPYQDIDMFFDFFNWTQKDANQIAKKDFKEFVLMNLRVRHIREQDLDMFLKSCFILQGKDHIDRNDFKAIFETYLREAQYKKLESRSDREMKYNSAQSFFKSGQGDRTMGLQQTYGQATNVFLDQSINNRDGRTPSFVEKRVDFGREVSPQMEERRTATLERPLRLGKSLEDQVKENVYNVINKFEDAVGVDTQYVGYEQFRQVMGQLSQDQEDIANFWGKYNFDNKFFYHQQLLQLSNAQLSQDESTALLMKIKEQENDPKLRQIKDKIKKHMLENDYSLEVIFKFLDKDKSNGISLQELTHGLKSFLSPPECQTLFYAVDKDRSGEISYNEIITECSKINSAFVLTKIQQTLTKYEKDKTSNPDKIFDNFDKNRTGEMEIQEFNEMLNFLYEGNIPKLEVDSLFKHFDLSGRGKISKADFKRALTQQITLENKMEPTIHELLTPLQTKLRQMNLIQNLEAVFDKFSKNKDTITIPDFRDLVFFFLKVQFTQEEEQQIINLISGLFNRGPNLDKNTFIQLLRMNFIVKSFGQGNRTVAAQTFQKIKGILRYRKKEIVNVVKPFCDEGTQRNINIRNMKIFLFTSFNLSSYDIENLIDYLDKDSNGFIPSQDFIKEVEMAQV